MMNRNFAFTPLFFLATVADAQGSLTISGTMDMGLQHLNGAGTSKSSVISGGNTTSKLVFRGTEVINPDLQTFFWLESGMSADEGRFNSPNVKNQPHVSSNSDGGMAFDRRAILGVKSTYGTVQVGRDWSPTYETFSAKFDPFAISIGIGLNYSGSKNSDGVRVSNSIAYLTPKIASTFDFKVQHWFGEGAGDSYGTGSGIRLGYESDNMLAALAYANTQLKDANIIYRNIAVNYRVVNDLAIILSANNDSYGQTNYRGWLGGFNYRLGAGEIKGSFSTIRLHSSEEPSGRKWALGYVHHLSRRTALYTTVAHISNRGGGTFNAASFAIGKNQSMNGVDLGIRHNF